MKTVQFNTSKGVKTGELVKKNKLTVWVKIAGKYGATQIKRHIKNDSVVFLD